MTNFEACEHFRSLVAAHGHLIPELMAHYYAGVTRQRWNEIRRSGRVSVVRHGTGEFVPLTWIETRSTRRGQAGLLSKLQTGKRLGLASDTPLRQRCNHSSAETLQNLNGSNIPTIPTRKPCQNPRNRRNSPATKKKGKTV